MARARRWLVAAAATAFLATSAAAFDAPLQVDLPLAVSARPGAFARARAAVSPGAATVRVSVRNLSRSRTALVDLVFDYRVLRGTIAFDELIQGIEITTASPGGGALGAVSLDAGLMPLNPNRGRVRYRATLLYPQAGPSYELRVRVFGNYE